jgi:spermidine synthase
MTTVLQDKLSYLRISVLALVSVTLYYGILHYLPPLPALWIVPFALYALSILMAFTHHKLINHKLLLSAKPFFILPLLVPLSLQLPPSIYSYSLYIIVFFFVSLLCHNEVITERDKVPSIMRFCLSVILGALAGAAFGNALPMLPLDKGFPLSISMVLLCFFLPHPQQSTVAKPSSIVVSTVLPIVFFLLLAGMRLLTPVIASLDAPLFEEASGFYTIAYCMVATALCFAFSKHPLRFGLGTAAIVVTGLLFQGKYNPYYSGDTLFSFVLTTELLAMGCAIALLSAFRSNVFFKRKTPFGLVEVKQNFRKNTLELFNNSTLHGTQSLDPALRHKPLSYYAESGPLGQIFAALPPERPITHIAVIGLGVGTIAAYGKTGQHFTFYEINPVMNELARNERYFTYLTTSPAQVTTIIGDAREKLETAPAHAYDMIICDAYSGKIIPKHLLTREALALYMDKLAPQGLLALHITNTLIDLLPILGKLVSNANLAGIFQRHIPKDTQNPATSPIKGLTLVPNKDNKLDETSAQWESAAQKFLTSLGLAATITPSSVHNSTWVVIARSSEDLAFLGNDRHWHNLPVPANATLWTDALWKYKSF